MKQSAIELFGILMNLEENFSILYKNISVLEGQYQIKLKNMASVLAREEQRHVEFYRDLISNMQEQEPLMVNEAIIAEAKAYLFNFKNEMSHSSIKTTGELLIVAIEYEEKNANILKSIVELLIDEKDEAQRQIIIRFEALIIEENKHAMNLKKFLR